MKRQRIWSPRYWAQTLHPKRTWTAPGVRFRGFYFWQGGPNTSSAPWADLQILRLPRRRMPRRYDRQIKPNGPVLEKWVRIRSRVRTAARCEMHRRWDNGRCRSREMEMQHCGIHAQKRVREIDDRRWLNGQRTTAAPEECNPAQRRESQTSPSAARRRL